MSAPAVVDFYTFAKGEKTPQSYHRTEAEALASLAEKIAADPARWTGGRAIPCDQYFTEREAFYLDKPAVEIEAAVFDWMLNVLPPMGWVQRDGVERFSMSEFTQGRITQQFARRNGRYLSRYVHADKRETFITAADFETLSPKLEG